MIGKLLGAATVGSAVMGVVGLQHRFLVAMAQMMLLTIVSSFMLCASLTFLFAILYLSLVAWGMAAYVALILLGLLALLTTAAVLLLTQKQIRKLRNADRLGVSAGSNSWADIGNIATAFVDGFLDTKS